MGVCACLKASFCADLTSCFVRRARGEAGVACGCLTWGGRTGFGSSNGKSSGFNLGNPWLEKMRGMLWKNPSEFLILNKEKKKKRPDVTHIKHERQLHLIYQKTMLHICLYVKFDRQLVKKNSVTAYKLKQFSVYASKNYHHAWNQQLKKCCTTMFRLNTTFKLKNEIYWMVAITPFDLPTKWSKLMLEKL